MAAKLNVKEVRVTTKRRLEGLRLGLLTGLLADQLLNLCAKFANVMTVKRVQVLERDKSIRYNVVLSGNYVQVANGGEILALNQALNPGFLPNAFWGQVGPDVTRFGVGYPLQGPGGLAAEIVPGADAFHPILKLFNTTTGNELAAGPYSAAVTGDTNFFLQFEGRNID